MALSLYDAQDVMRKESDNTYNINIYLVTILSKLSRFLPVSRFQKKLSDFFNDGSRSDLDHWFRRFKISSIFW